MGKQKILERNMEQLATLGKKKGYLTYDEINHFLPEEITTADEMGSILEYLDNHKISVLESSQVSQWTRSKKTRTSSVPPVDDPVKMYLKQMGQIPLLSRENEVSLAKEIERSEEHTSELQSH